VIKTLKRALQPVIADVGVAWELESGYTVHQIPSSLPPLFSGDRLVVYGVLKVSENANDSNSINVVRLQGAIENGGQLDHKIAFTTSAVDDSLNTDNNEADVNVNHLHLLAAKTTIQEKQDEFNESRDYGQVSEEAKSYIISISKLANVVSQLTSIVAVDKDSREPVSGPLHYHELHEVSQYCGLDSAMVEYSKRSYRGKTKGGFGCFSFRSKNSPNKASKGKSKVKSKGFLSALFGSATSAEPSLKGAASLEPSSKGAASTEPVVSDVEERSEDDDNLSLGRESRRPNSKDPSTSMWKSSPSPQKSPQSALTIIGLQKASGPWDLTEQLVSLCGMSRDDLIKGCPEEIAADTAEGKLLWATALALVLLMGKYSNQKDEWEMIAEKGKKWLKKNLPSTDTFTKVLNIAAAVVGVQDIPEL
ncbi:unnamed protein product, partial [Pocillopora meandrina]